MMPDGASHQSLRSFRSLPPEEARPDLGAARRPASRGFLLSCPTP